MSSRTEQFHSWLTSHGIEPDDEHAAVAEVVFQQRPPFTGESLYAAVSFSQGDLDIGRSTVSRVLNQLCDAGLVAGDGECLERFFHTAQEPLPGDVSPERCAMWHGIMQMEACPFCDRSTGRCDSM